jgi:UDP-N-acetylmuramate dehydrogenase
LLELRNRTTAKVGGAAAEVIAPASIRELVAAVGELRERQRVFRLLGGGSNVIAGDAPLEEPIVWTRGVSTFEKQTPTLWRVDAGVALGEIVHRSARGGLTGLECCAGVPGTIGAAIRINAGGKFGTISSVLREVTVLTASGRILRRATTPEDFAYRRSAFWDDVVLEALIELAPARDFDPCARIREVLDHKKSTQPLRFPSAGCIFRNPSREMPAGMLIDRAGLKGARIGGAVVSEQHANYIVNTGGATGSDFLALMDFVREQVRARFGIELELEVEVWR